MRQQPAVLLSAAVSRWEWEWEWEWEWAWEWEWEWQVQGSRLFRLLIQVCEHKEAVGVLTPNRKRHWRPIYTSDRMRTTKAQQQRKTLWDAHVQCRNQLGALQM